MRVVELRLIGQKIGDSDTGHCNFDDRFESLIKIGQGN